MDKDNYVVPMGRFKAAALRKKGYADIYWQYGTIDELVEWMYGPGVKQDAVYVYPDLNGELHYFSLSSMPSGSLWTAIDNSIVNVANLADFLRRNKHGIAKFGRVVDRSVLGDDSLMVVQLHDTENYGELLEIAGSGFQEVSRANGFEVNSKSTSVPGTCLYLRLMATHGMYIPQPTMDSVGSEKVVRFLDPIGGMSSMCAKYFDMVRRGAPYDYMMKRAVLLWTFSGRRMKNAVLKKKGVQENFYLPFMTLYTPKAVGGVGMGFGVFGHAQDILLYHDLAILEPYFDATSLVAGLLDGRSQFRMGKVIAELNVAPDGPFYKGVERVRKAIPPQRFLNELKATQSLKESGLPDFIINKIPSIQDIPERRIKEALQGLNIVKDHQLREQVGDARSMIFSVRRKPRLNPCRDVPWFVKIDRKTRKPAGMTIRFRYGDRLEMLEFAKDAPSPCPTFPSHWRYCMKHYHMSSADTGRFTASNFIARLNDRRFPIHTYTGEEVFDHLAHPQIWTVPTRVRDVLIRMGFPPVNAAREANRVWKNRGSFLTSTTTHLLSSSQGMLGWINLAAAISTMYTGDKRFDALIVEAAKSLYHGYLVRGGSPRHLHVEFVRRDLTALLKKYVLRDRVETELLEVSLGGYVDEGVVKSTKQLAKEVAATPATVGVKEDDA
jgi:hypothetical protein